MLINDEHHRQIAQAKAMFDAEIDGLRREMASAKFDFDLKTHKVLKGLPLVYRASSLGAAMRLINRCRNQQTLTPSTRLSSRRPKRSSIEK